MDIIRSYTLKSVVIFFIYFIFVYPLQHVEASEGIQLHNGKERYSVGPVLELLEDKENKWTIYDVAGGSLDDQFFQFNGNIPSYGYSSSAFWVRMTFDNQSESEEWLLELAYPPHDYVSLYTPIEEDNFKKSETGDLLPFSSREIQHRNFIYELSIPPGEVKTYYLKLKSDGSMQIPITLWSENEFHQKSLLEYIILGLYYGFGLIMILYNLSLYISLRLSSYLWYILFIFSIMVVHFTLNGLSFQYLWSDMPWWNHRSILFFMAVTNISALFFTKSFLITKSYIPTLNKLLNWYIIIHPILIGILFLSYEIALNLIMGATIGVVIIIITAAVRCYKRGYNPAKYFLYGWVIFLVGVMITSLADMGLIPISFMTKYASQLGSSTEIVLFSLALAEKIKLLRIEKEAAETLARKSQALALRHLQQANQMKDEFLAKTSHELRTPLHGIVGIAESLQGQSEVDERIKNNLSLIISSGKRLTNLINDLLDASKLKYQGIELNIHPVSLPELVEVVCTISSSLIVGKPVVIRNHIPESIPSVAGDENRLQQILYNLIGNGIKYTPKGEIVLNAEVKGKYILVSVRDTGIGITESEIEKVFQNFERGTNAFKTSAKGTGLGLSITKQLVALHGGEIFIQSKLGEGTTVSFTVPIYKGEGDFTQQIITNPHNDHAVEVKNHESAAPNEKRETIGKILIADDEPVNIRVLYNHLTMAGYEVDFAYDGDRVLEQVKKSKLFDLIILDVMLPKKSGFDVTKKIREHYSLTELPILMLTARSQVEDIVTAFEMGANDYLTKPCSKEELLARVKTLLSLKLATEEVISVNYELQQLNQSLESQVIQRTEELEIKTEQLSRLEKARRELMSNISHELGTPMTSVRGYLKAMIDGMVEASDPKYLNLVYQKVLVIDRLIQDLYELSRLEARKVSFRWKKHTIYELITTLFAKYELDVKAHNIDFVIINHLHQEEMYKEVLIDINRIDQVVHNLIFNAIRYTNSSGLITVELKKWNNRGDSPLLQINKRNIFLKISVRDTGKGISAETIPHIFDRFYQEEKSRTQQGTNIGLGLSISKEIIEYHHGHIWVESKVGEGSTFHFILPFHPDQTS